MSDREPQPVVSVIIATYNRSYTLRHAIQSVIDSSVSDWELLIIGDGCTDDTGECVASFKDARIRFVNLPVRCGYQSAPNNHGVGLSRGKFIAFLNHDDFYLPDHLANCMTALENSDADLVWVPCLACSPPEEAPGENPPAFSVIGVPVGMKYTPLSFCAPSSWVFRRDLASRVGPWSDASSLYVLPSQDWLFRASRIGAKLKFLPKIGVVKMAAEPGCYARRESPAHEWMANTLRGNPEYLEDMLEAAAISGACQTETNALLPPWRTILRLWRRPVFMLLIAMGQNPMALNRAIIFRRRGGEVRKLRRSRERIG